MEVKGKRIFVGLSGGVDSAVSAALLKRVGALVTGVFIKGWYPSGMPCTWAKERRDAMLVAARLGIPFRTLDASAEYKAGVIEYLLREYRAGRTPNPDVACNKEVKFGAFYRYAVDSGADFIATGHYRSGENDQSYFLWAAPEEALGKTIFPVGDMEKKEVRKLAKEFNLPVWDKPDSQGICFLGEVSIADFLRQEFGTKQGSALTPEGDVVGTHQGAVLYTLGERLSLDGGRVPGPWFVVAKDLKKNELTVSKEKGVPAGEEENRTRFTNALWHGEPGGVVEAQYRYRGVRLTGRIEGDFFVSEKPLPERPAPGQSIVWYRSGTLLGGGIISE